MSLLRRRAKSRSCTLHGDNGCEIQGEAGPRTRASEKRIYVPDDIEAELNARAYVSRLWARDWDSEEDTAYDQL